MELPINDEKYEYIILNTILDVNRVLENWKLNKKVVTYEDKISLFKSWFARHFKHKFNYQTYLKYISKESILPIIDNYQLININMTIKYPNIHTTKLEQILNKTNFIDINNSVNIIDKIKKLNNDTEIVSLVDYNKLLNIKFK